MAIIYSYPLNDNIKLSDELVGTTEKIMNGQLKTVTRNFLLQDLAEFFIVDGGLQKEITLTTNFTSGAATLNQVTGVLNIPQYSGGSTIIPAALTKVNDTNVTLTLGGSPSNALLQGVSLTLGWTGTLNDDRITNSSVWNAKQNAITTGTTLQYLRGDLSLATFPTIPTVGTWGALNYPTWTTGTPFVKMTATGTFSLDTNTYYLASNPSGFTNNTGTVTSIVTSSPLTGGTITTSGTIGITQATTTTNGYLTSSDWNIFSNKEPTLGNPSTTGYVLSSTTAGVRSWVAQSGSGGAGSIPHATASGTDTYTATISGITSYADGDAYLIRFTNGNTTVCTLNINGLGVIPLYRNNDGPLIGGDVQNGGEMLCVYNSTLATFQCIGTSPNSIISYVTNADSVTVTKGQAVYAFSGQGDRVTVKRAFNTSDSTSAQTIGIVMSTSIGVNQKGFIMMQGLLDNLSTLPATTYADGSPVYLGATAGSITNIKPYAPNHLVYLGIVTTASNGSAGRMYVRVQNGYELDELHNVQAQTPTLKDTLWYDNTVSPAQWKTASISSILGFTPANDSSVVHLTGNETIAGLKTFTSDLTATKYLYSGGSIFPEFGSTFYINGDTRTHYFGGGTSNVQNNLEVSNGTLKIGLQTASTIASFDANKNVVSLPLATYPSLTELSYAKGVTSSIQTQFSGKQPINANLTSISSLSTVSGASFVKVYNGAYFLEGDAFPPQSAYTMLANNTASTAVPTEQPFENITNATYSGTPAWTPGTAPSGTTAHTYSLSQVGNLVTLTINLSYGSAGASTLTTVILDLPSTAPTPAIPTSVIAANEVISYGTGMIAVAKTVPTTNAPFCALRRNATNTGNEIVIIRAQAAYRYAYVTIQYFV